ncbi:MAG: polysaccharide biosynthesis tyrosine autokinase [Rikenellaceae bacterium]|nr:polysaccharide biosynthesis tyrosine autokinase [Rikenellaceae bacterium]
MENISQNNTSYNVANDEGLFQRAVSLRELVIKSLKNWYWFAASMFVFLCVGVLYLLSTAPVYHREATVLIKDARRGSAASELSAFADIAGISTRRSVDNELYVLQARRLMVEVVDRLNLTTNYTMKSGLRTVTLYKNSPISITYVDNLGNKGCNFTVLLGEDGVTVSEFACRRESRDERKADEKFTATAKFGEVINLPIGQIVINPTLYFVPEEFVGEEIFVSKGTKDIVATAYRNKVQMSVANKMASIINLSLNDVVPQRADDILNTLLDVYNDDAVTDKQIVAEATAKFINERLQVIGEELHSIDSNIKQFKDKNNIVDIKTEATRRTEGAIRYEQEIAVTSNQIAMSKFICDYLSDNSKDVNVIPATTFEGSAAISSQIANYNELVIRRLKLGNDSENNPLVQQLNNNIASTKNAIISSLVSHISALEIKLANLEKEERKINSLIGAVPKQEQEFLSIARQQKIKEELYLYLLTKSEENAISLAITERPARVVDYAFGMPRPVAPNKTIILLAMLVLGFGLPLAVIYILILTDTKVQGKHDIVKYCTAPYLGDIPLFEGHLNRSIAVRESGRDKVSEAFKILRTNMGFMSGGTKQQVILTTSSNAHAGKTFVSMNLGMTLAFSGNKVLMIDLDLRRRTLSKHMGQRSNPNGVTKYLSTTDVNVNDIISKSGLHENFDFIYAGLQPPNPAELLMSKRLDALIEECRKHYDYIIIDSVPALIIADAMITSRVADLSIYVVREGLLERQQLPDINALHSEGKLHNMCIVLNGASESRQSYGYSYRYQYTSGSDKNNHGWRKVLKRLGLLK